MGIDMHYDLTDLRLFLHVGELLNLTRAAEKSFLSVPSASLRINVKTKTNFNSGFHSVASSVFLHGD